MGRQLLIAGGDVRAPGRVIRGGAVLIQGGRIAEVGTLDEMRQAALEAEIIDAGGLVVVPGFIDLQINGAYGRDFSSDPQGIVAVARRLPETGVTSFLPTIVSSPFEVVREAMAIVSEGVVEGAQPLGVHMEGPFLNPEKCGAHDGRWLRSPADITQPEWKILRKALLITLAPELPGGFGLIKRLRNAGVIVSAGHSLASYDAAHQAFEAGIRFVTHLFNAMSPMHHRQPGLIGAAFDDRRVRVGVIADGTHLHPAIIRLIWRLKKAPGMVLLTYAMQAMGQPAGRYRLGEQTAIVSTDSGSVRLEDGGGTLAGSIARMDSSVRVLMDQTGCSLFEAVRSASASPAAVLGRRCRKGRLKRGYDADVTLLTREGNIAGCIVNGVVLYRAPSGPLA